MEPPDSPHVVRVVLLEPHPGIWEHEVRNWNLTRAASRSPSWHFLCLTQKSAAATVPLHRRVLKCKYSGISCAAEHTRDHSSHIEMPASNCVLEGTCKAERMLGDWTQRWGFPGTLGLVEPSHEYCEQGCVTGFETGVLSCEKTLVSVPVLCGGLARPTCSSAIYGNASPQIDVMMSQLR